MRTRGGPARRRQTEEAFLDAAERLLTQVGYAQISTRRLAEEAQANHGLVHYYFGSMENVFVRVLERCNERLIRRRRAIYAQDLPFLEKWRAAMRFIEEDRAAGYPKIWLELHALGWNHPDIRELVGRLNAEWRAVLTEAFDGALDEYGIDREHFPLEAWVSLVMTFDQGMELERLSGVDHGHRVLLEAVDRWVAGLATARAAATTPVAPVREAVPMRGSDATTGVRTTIDSSAWLSPAASPARSTLSRWSTASARNSTSTGRP